MSWRVVALVYSRKLGSQFRKSVMAYLADKASDGGEGIWCSKGTVARDLEASRSTVFKVIEQFEDEGLLIRIGTRSHRNGKTVEYALDLAKIEALELVRPADQSAKSTSPPSGPVRQADQSEAKLTSPSGGPVRDTDPDQSVRRTGTSPSGGPKPSVEQSLEQEECSRTLGAPAREKPPPKHFLPPGWEPTDADRAYADKHGLNETEIKEIADDFRAYWSERGDKNARRTPDGWRRTWQTRIREVAPQYRRNRSRAAPAADRPGYFETAANAPAPDGGESRLTGLYAPGASRRR